MIDTGDFWLLTALLAVGTFLIRFSFLGIFGGRSVPHWAQMHLKYVGVAVFPALVAPLVMWPEATGGAVDPVRLVAAVAAFLIGLGKVPLFGSTSLKFSPTASAPGGRPLELEPTGYLPR